MYKIYVPIFAVLLSMTSLHAMQPYTMEQFLTGLETGLKISGISYKYPRPQPAVTQAAPVHSQPASTTQDTSYTFTPLQYKPQYQQPRHCYNTSNGYQQQTPAEKSEIQQRIAQAQLFNLITKKQ